MIVIKSGRVRKWLRILLPCVLMPALVALGAIAFPGQYDLLIALALAVLALLLFATGFEKRKTGSRRLVLTSIMTALCIVGRFIPLFKPVTALTILTGMYLGGEAGFLTGALAALCSNFLFGQGPWTPFQMLSWGLIGLVAGVLAKPLKRSLPFLCLYGVVAGAAFSMLMDVWTVLWYGQGFDPALYQAALITALPHTALYALSNVAFLLLLARPIGKKLERVHVKYGV